MLVQLWPGWCWRPMWRLSAVRAGLLGSPGNADRLGQSHPRVAQGDRALAERWGRWSGKRHGCRRKTDGTAASVTAARCAAEHPPAPGGNAAFSQQPAGFRPARERPAPATGRKPAPGSLVAPTPPARPGWRRCRTPSGTKSRPSMPGSANSGTKTRAMISVAVDDGGTPPARRR